MNRREFLLSLARGDCAAALPRTSAADAVGATVSCTLFPDQIVGHVPADFMGLSFEAGALSNTGLFDPANKALIAFVRTLGANGVLRFGGNSSEFTEWDPRPGADLTDIALPYNIGKKHRRTAMTTTAIDNLARFLDAVDWRLIYGLNLGMGTPDQAAEEAAYVSRAVGERLMYFQIGNEADLFHHNGLRPTAYAFDDFFTEWSKFADAVVAKTPHAPLAGPDVAHNNAWIKSFAEKAAGRIGLLSGHYYAEGPPTNPDMTIPRLLRGNKQLLKDIDAIGEVCETSRLPYRMTECNSCYSGGKKGVSDTFASALWAVDYTLQLASAGYAGVNFHGGGSGNYTPIAGDPAAGYGARPLYYGLLMAAQFAGVDLVRADVDTGAVNATVYAGRSANRLLVAITNKDISSPISLAIDPGLKVDGGSVWRLAAPSVDATSLVTLAGATVSADGTWSPSTEETVEVSGGKIGVDVPAASAALLFLRYS